MTPRPSDNHYPMPSSNLIKHTVRQGWQGNCEVCNLLTLTILAVVPNVRAAIDIAEYAVSDEGGYMSVIIGESFREVTHTTAIEWILS